MFVIRMLSIVTAIFCLYGAVLLFRLGILKTPNIEGLQSKGPFQIASISRIGSYYNIMDDIDRLVEELRAKKMNIQWCMGIYLDDPEKVTEKKLRSEAHINDLNKIIQNHIFLPLAIVMFLTVPLPLAVTIMMSLLLIQHVLHQQKMAEPTCNYGICP